MVAIQQEDKMHSQVVLKQIVIYLNVTEETHVLQERVPYKKIVRLSHLFIQSTYSPVF